MELFVPTFFILVLGVIICFFVLPKMSPYILGVVGIVLFIIGVWQHMKLFSYEYSSTSNTHDMIKSFSPFIMIVGVIISAMIMVHLVYGTEAPSVASVMPNIAMPNISVPNILSPATNKNSVTNMMKSLNPLNMNKRPNLASTSFKTV